MYLAPNAVQQYFDDNGQFLVGGLLFSYQAGTASKQSVFTDSSGNTPLPNPIVLNARGEVAPSATGTSCGVWLDPTLAYKFVLAPPSAGDPPTSTFWTIDNIVSAESAVLAALKQYEATLAGVQIGTIVVWGGFSLVPAGWFLCYGQAISRTTYGLLFAVIGTAFGGGDGTTTFNLPDLRGRLPLGADNMGGSSANRVTLAVAGILTTAIGNTGGDQNAQADPINASASAVSGVTDPGHFHGIVLSTVGSNVPSNQVNGVPGSASGTGQTQLSNTGITVTTVITSSVTTGLTGGSQNMPPVQVFNYLIYAGQ